MDQMQLGGFEITRVEELNAPLTSAFQFFPDLTKDMLDAARPEIPNGHLSDSDEIILSFHSYVVKTGRYTILVDTCCGNDKERPSRPAFSHLNSNYLGTLAAAGCRPEDVDFVMCTHLHWDHIGWNTQLVDGEWVPTFPNAKYIMARREYEHWDRLMQDPDNMHRFGFQDSVQPLMRAEQAVLVEDDHEIDNGVWLEPCHGHSPGHVVVNLASGDAKGAMTGDVIHHRVQLVYPKLSTIADSDQSLSRRNRTALMERHADSGSILFPAHFRAPSFGSLRSKIGKDGYDFVPAI